jgi:polygalacturonase
MRLATAALLAFGLVLPGATALAQPATPTPPPPPPTPSFPSRTCDVKTFGAKGDGSTNDTPAINSAISSCNSQGGGTVSFPTGTYMAASIHLKSNIRLLLTSGSILRARSSGFDAPESNSFSQYQDFGHSHFHNGLMWGENISNFAVEGPGKIDGAGLTTGDPSSGGGDKQVSLKTCNTVSFRNLTQTKGGHFFYLLSDCTNVTFDNVVMSDGRDGIDFMGCKHVDVNNIRVTGVGDDVCALKNDYAQGRRLLTQDTYIHDSTFATKCNAIQVGSETAGDFRNCHWQRITVQQAGKAGIGLQTNDGGILDGFYINDVTIQKAAVPIFINASSRLRTPESVGVGHIQNVYISNVTSSGSTQTGNDPVGTSSISGYQGINHRNINFWNVKITMPGGGSFADGNINPPYSPDDNYNPRSLGTRPSYGFYVRDADGVQFHNLRLDYSSTDLRPAFKAVTTDNLEIDDFGAERAASGAWDSIRLTTVTNFSLHDSLGYPTVQQASVSSAGYSAGSATATPTATPTSRVTPTATATPTATGTPTGGGTWEAESLSPVASGATTAMNNDTNATGGTWLALNADGAGDSIQFTTPALGAGTYSVTLRYKAHTARGILQASVDGMNLGGTLDEYVATPAFMTRTFGSVALPAGAHTLRLTCTGKNSASSAFTLSADTVAFALTSTPTPTPTPTPTFVPTASPTPTPTMTATPTPTSGFTYLWPEAESGTVTAPLQILADSAASAGQYIMVAAGNNSSAAAPTTGQAGLTFTVPASGTFKIWGRVIAPANTDDSFWVRVDGGTWINWNDIVAGAAWHWAPVTNDASSDAVVSYALGAGTHTLTFAYREDGAKLDRVLITNDLAFTPSGVGP